MKNRRKYLIRLFLILMVTLNVNISQSQTFSIKDAVEQAVKNYGNIKAKESYAEAAQQRIEKVKRDYLPNFNVSAQQSFGTINGQYGPSYGLGGLGVASSGPLFSGQNWNAAFGALYLANVNWEFFSFGRSKQRVELAKSEANQLEKDYQQEIFEQKIKVASAYLNLLASKRLLVSQQRNLERAEIIKRNISTRVKTGMLPGVDSTMAAAEVSRAKITLNQVLAEIKTRNNELAQLLGSEVKDFELDTLFISSEPEQIQQALISNDSVNHPVRQYFQSRIDYSNQEVKLYRKSYMPSFSLFGVYQTRGSGFGSNYTGEQATFTKNYFNGINPTIQNYLFGVGVVWNLTSISRANKNIASQKLITKGLEDEYKMIDLELKSRSDAANSRIKYSLENFREAPVQVRAAQQAYHQRLALYNNGLTNLTDVITAQYALNHAETDADIAAVNLWEALLMKAAAIGDFNLFINQF
ncbi:MAG TPA: TolC family protein [Agriterribacter sp.]|nr:TolC family protein [Agriterribacter sp.]